MCIESIRGFTAPDTYEIIVIDNASKDGSVEWLRTQKDIRCIYNKENLGFPKGCNQGMAIAAGTEILLLNSDVIVTPRWLEQLKIALYSDEKVGAVGCVTSKCSNLQQIEVPYDTQNVNIEELIDFAEEFNHSNPEKWLPHYKLVGFCMMFRTSLYKEIGGLDEAFSPGNYEDDDYSIRIRLAGYKILLCADTFIHHFGSGSFIRKRSPEEEREHTIKYWELMEKNKKYFLNKWSLPVDHNIIRLDRNKVDQISELMLGARNVLIIGHCDIYDVLQLIWNNVGVNIEYMTTAKHESTLFHNEFPLYYVGNLMNGLRKINKKYDLAIITSTVQCNMYGQEDITKCVCDKKISNNTITIS
jgi:GT2 family glycosyltransferase